MKQIIIILSCLVTALLVSAQKKNQATISSIEVVERPVIGWTSYPVDSTYIVGSNIQTFSAKITSRVPLSTVEVKINGITSDVYEASQFSPPVSKNHFEEIIERSITLRTGTNSILIVVKNSRGITAESSRKVMVDPTQITLLRSTKDRNPPMIYVSNPDNISKADRVVLYDDIVRLSGTVIDESGIQELKVNGQVVPVKENGGYVINLPMNVGDNPIAIEAKDLNQNIALRKFIVERKNMDGTAYRFEDARNYLFVVGIDHYSTWPTLYNAVADADTIVQVLTNLYEFDANDVTVLRNEEATRSNIYEGLRAYIEKITPRDNLLIYFSGHGYFDKLLSEGYWVPEDAQAADVSGYISNAQVMKIIENINSQHTLIIADACFSGSLFASTTRGFSDHVERYRSRWGLASGRLEYVSDGTKGANSPFARSIVEYLASNTAKKIPVSDLVQYVKKNVSSSNGQTPVGNPLKGVGDDGGEFIFYKRIK